MMKKVVISLLLCACFVVTTAEPAKQQGMHEMHIADIEKKLNALLDLEEELENEIEDEIQEAAKDSTITSYAIENEDPCATVYCTAGRACAVNTKGKGVCQCVESCEIETDPRRRVCSNHNETWMTDCDLHRQRCLCEDELPDCQDEMYKHLHINYFGQCQQQPECSEDEFLDFPRRMREWLFNVMRDMADRHILPTHYRMMEKEAEEDETQRWSKAAVWKWCDLDESPKDKVVSRHELFPIRAPLYTLEHCIAPFLNSCDADDDHQITIKEWGKCLHLDEDDMEDMDTLCEEIRDKDDLN